MKKYIIIVIIILVVTISALYLYNNNQQRKEDIEYINDLTSKVIDAEFNYNINFIKEHIKDGAIDDLSIFDLSRGKLASIDSIVIVDMSNDYAKVKAIINSSPRDNQDLVDQFVEYIEYEKTKDGWKIVSVVRDA